MSETPPPRTVLSLHAILLETIAILDEQGVFGLTIRRLAERLGTGVSSIYWYVATKDELISRAAEELTRHSISVLPEDPRRGPRDPLKRLRLLLLDLYEQIDAHPWLGARLSADGDRHENALRLWELVGQHVQALGVGDPAAFHYTSAIMNYVVGVGAQMATARFRVPEGMDRDAYLDESVQRWLRTDPTEFPFVHAVAAQMREHDDRDQFEAGLDLLLAGLAARRP